MNAWGRAMSPVSALPKVAPSGPRSRARICPARVAHVSSPGAGRATGRTSRLEPLSAGGYDLHYAYVLVPRLPNHRLEGDLAEKISVWLPQLCLAFAWRLENISVQPEFVQWMLSMSPDTSPESVVTTLEKHLSEPIFDEFPAFQARESVRTILCAWFPDHERRLALRRFNFRIYSTNARPPGASKLEQVQLHRCPKLYI